MGLYYQSRINPTGIGLLVWFWQFLFYISNSCAVTELVFGAKFTVTEAD